MKLAIEMSGIHPGNLQLTVDWLRHAPNSAPRAGCLLQVQPPGAWR